MKTIQEMIEVMQAFNEGKSIQFKANTGIFWHDITNPKWDWISYDYRVVIKPKTRPMTLEEIIEWRKKSNGVIFWYGSTLKEITTVKKIIPEEKDKFPIYIDDDCHALSFFIEHAYKSDGTKFEVEEDE